MEEKKKYKKKNDFKINIIFNDKGEALEKIIERAFGNYCLKTKSSSPKFLSKASLKLDFNTSTSNNLKLMKNFLRLYSVNFKKSHL